MSRHLAPLLLALALASCKKTDPAPVVEKGPAGTEKIELAASSSPEAMPASYLGPVVAYSKAGGLVLDGQQILGAGTADDGFPTPKSSTVLMVQPLADKITTKPESALVAFEGATPYRLVIDVLFTLGQAAVGHFDLLVEKSKKRGIVPLSPPRSGDTVCLDVSPAKVAEIENQLLEALAGVDAGGIKRPVKNAKDAGEDGGADERVPLASRPALCLSVSLKDSGIAVHSLGDPVEATCRTLAPLHATTTTIAKGSAPDVLDACLAQLATFQGARKGIVTVSAKRETQWQDVMAMLDAVRKAGLTPALGLARP